MDCALLGWAWQRVAADGLCHDGVRVAVGGRDGLCHVRVGVAAGGRGYCSCRSRRGSGWLRHIGVGVVAGDRGDSAILGWVW